MIQTPQFPAFLLVIICLGIVLSGCDESFRPLAENDQIHFSIYGTLDANADTQKIRVTPVRRSTISSPDPVDATVTLEHLESGQKTTLRDSIYSFLGDNYGRNYLTDMDLEPGESYRLAAEDSDGRMSEATVTLPNDFPEPGYNLVCNMALEVQQIEVFIEGIDNLAAVTAYYYYKDETSANPRQSILKVQQYDKVREEQQAGSYYVRVNVVEDITALLGREDLGISHIQLDSISVFTAKAGRDWPEVEGLNIEEQILPDVANNVENGVGFLAGIVSRTLTVDSSCE